MAIEMEQEQERKDALLKRVRDRYARAKEHWDPIYDKARTDLKFLSDDSDAQWDPQVLADRRAAGLNCITLDKCDQSVNQVINGIRQNTPSINVIPDGEGSDDGSAEEFMGIIRGIQYQSRADTAYDTAAENSVKARIGYIVVDNEYAHDDGFEQKLCIKRVVNPLTIYIDPTSIELDGSDADYGFVLEPMRVSDFKAKWPGEEVVPFGDDPEESKGGERNDDDEISVGQYFEKVFETVEKVQMADGSIHDFVEGMEYKNRRTFKKTTITRCRLSGAAILEETVFPGKYIPIVPVYGKEAWEDGKRKLQCLTSKVKQAAQLHNLWASVETDMLLRASRSPIVAPEGTTEPFIDDYRNPDKVPVLRYVPYDGQGNPLPAPKRLDPFPIPTGVVNARRESVDDMKAAMGIYNASLGAQSNETSGIAIGRRQAQSDIGNFHYGDNLSKSVEQVGRIIVFAYPEIYDTPRQVLSIDAEDNAKMVGINGETAEGQDQTLDLRKGRYTVRVTTGPGYTTKKQEAFAVLGDMFRAQPQLVQSYGDIFFKNGDFAGSQAMAKRAEKMLPPGLKEEGDDAEKAALMQQNQQLTQAVAALQQQIQSGAAEAQIKAQADQQKAQADIAKAQIDREIAIANLQSKQIDLAIKNTELEAKRLDFGAGVLQPQLSSTEGTQSGIPA